MALVPRMVQGDIRAASRLLTLVQERSPQARAALARLPSAPSPPRVIGVTGAPGVGKSLLVDRLVNEFRQRGLRVGVLAVDPSSPVSRGALLGDRIRMRSHFTDAGVFIRSVATRGAAGGIPVTVIRESIRVMEAMGMDLVIVETIGVGQDQIAVASVADIVVGVFTPAAGDEIQMLKSGLQEVADLWVVNKSDLPGAEQVARELAESQENGNRVPILQVSALRETGIRRLAELLLGEPNERRRRRKGNGWLGKVATNRQVGRRKGAP